MIPLIFAETFDIGRAAGFSSTVSLYRPLWGFHRLLSVIPIIDSRAIRINEGMGRSL
jgi:hypothetical protein